MKISIVIPTYNEEKNIASSLDKTIDYLRNKDFKYEVIITDDGSNDKTINIVNKYIKKYPFIKLLKNNHTGKAGTVRKGMLYATGDIILFTDADFATPIDTIDSIIPYFKKGADLVIGSRKMGKRMDEPKMRKLAGNIYNFLVRTLLLKDISDTQAGFKAFTRTAVDNIFSRMIRFGDNQKLTNKPKVTGFDLEIIYIAQSLGYKIISIPLNWKYVESKRVNLFRDSYLLFMDLIVIKINSIMGKYKFKSK